MNTDHLDPAAAPLLRDRRRRRRESLWLLSPILLFGLGTAASFLYIGLRARRPAWWVPGLGYAAATVYYMAASAPPDWLPVTVWAVGLIHALTVNPSRLRLKAAAAARSHPAPVSPHRPASWPSPAHPGAHPAPGYVPAAYAPPPDLPPAYETRPAYPPHPGPPPAYVPHPGPPPAHPQPFGSAPPGFAAPPAQRRPAHDPATTPELPAVDPWADGTPYP